MSDDTKPTVDREGLAKLREPFGPEHVGKLPKVTCPNCVKRSCQEHQKSKCQECGNWISPRHIHIDYVGHGALTHRLLDVDPEWDWEPLAWDDDLPRFVTDRNDNPIGLWIKLTVCGKTRLGFGNCNPGHPEAEKILIGDALRNAGMRFGIALDLWVKGHGEDDEKTTATDERSGPARQARQSRGAPKPQDTVKAEDMIPADDAQQRLVAAASGDLEAAQAAWREVGLSSERKITPQKMAEALAQLENPTDAVRESFNQAIGERRQAAEQAEQQTLAGADK